MIAVTDPFSRPRVAIPDTVELRGPADADHFRVKVGRYGDRWYTDPLDGDHIAPASDATFPSVSTCKKASGSDWSFVALKRVATAMDTEKYAKLAQWPWGDRYEALKAINKLGLNGAAHRGTNVHLMAEARLYGRPDVVGQGDPGWEYRGAVDQFFDQYQPTLVAAEFVCIHRTLNGAGYGGTSDAIIEIDGKRYLVDWKSRGVDSEHGGYPEEAAQIAGYAGADYIIVESAMGPQRQHVPHLDGGLIVSIKPDGCRVYPVDLDKGFAHWTALHAWWVARQAERAPVGRPLAPRKAPLDPAGEQLADSTTEVAPSLGGEIVEGGEPTGLVHALGPSGAAPPSTPFAGEVEGAACTPSPALNSTRDGASLVDSDGGSIGQPVPAVAGPDPSRLALVDARGTLSDNPLQGADLSDGEAYGELWDRMQVEFNALPAEARSWRAALVTEAQRRGVPFHVQECRSERAYHINKGLIALATAGQCDDEIVRHLLGPIVGDVAYFVGVGVGHVVGSLGATEAERFAALVDAFLAEPGGDAA